VFGGFGAVQNAAYAGSNRALRGTTLRYRYHLVIAVNNQNSADRYAPSPADVLLARCLAHSDLNALKFRRKYAIGPFVFDLVCPERLLVIEIDGDHPGRSIAYDWERAQYLQRRGYRVMRVWGVDIENNPALALEAIRKQTGRAAFIAPVQHVA
jgi:very-short-patch-repair endonuclease